LEQTRESGCIEWKRCIEVAVEMDVDVLNTELTGHSDKPYECEQMFMRSMKELLPIIEREGINLYKVSSFSLF
jgi:myo-inositol catabolism protein IolH